MSADFAESHSGGCAKKQPTTNLLNEHNLFVTSGRFFCGMFCVLTLLCCALRVPGLISQLVDHRRGSFYE